MTNERPFLTVDKQIELLKSRGLIIDDGAENVLMREGYYAIVNGYKDPFLDQGRSNEAGDDRYRPGTTFGHLHLLFKFDRMLRRAAFDALIPAETAFKTACTYAFCKRHADEPTAYLDASSYSSMSSYRHPHYYANHLSGLQRTFATAIENRDGRPSVNHYKERYGFVPLWVLSNVLTFGNFSYFYALLPRGVQNDVCKIIAEEQGIRFIRTNRLDDEVQALVKFRNICAHDDRLYCARVGVNHYRYFSDLMLGLRFLVDESTFESFVFATSRAVGIFDSLPWLRRRILREMHVEMNRGRIQPRGGWDR